VGGNVGGRPAGLCGFLGRADQQAKLHRRCAGEICTRVGFDAASSDEVLGLHHEVQAKALVHSRDRAIGAQVVVLATGSQELLQLFAYVALERAARRRVPAKVDRLRLGHRWPCREQPQEQPTESPAMALR
jgi:hypothetical protein